VYHGERAALVVVRTVGVTPPGQPAGGIAPGLDLEGGVWGAASWIHHAGKCGRDRR
jgi:hypothetical protein